MAFSKTPGVPPKINPPSVKASDNKPKVSSGAFSGDPALTRVEATRWMEKEIYGQGGIANRARQLRGLPSGITRRKISEKFLNETFGNISEPAWKGKAGPIGRIFEQGADMGKLQKREQLLKSQARMETDPRKKAILNLKAKVVKDFRGGK